MKKEPKIISITVYKGYYISEREDGTCTVKSMSHQAMKATFQKPDATYPHGSLREQPDRVEPDWNELSESGHGFMGIKLEWEEYLKTLRTIPCSENNWKNGQELEEGKDYELDLIDDGGWTGKWVAVPIVAQETEDELWNEVGIIFVGGVKFTCYPAILERLKKSYFIQRRKQ